MIINYFLLSLGHCFTHSVVPLFCEESTSRGCAMQPVRVGDLRGRVPGLLPDAAGGSGERGHFWHEQQNTAANNFRRSIGRLAQGLSPVYTRRQNPIRFPSARPSSQRGGGSDEVKQESPTSFYFKQRQASLNLNSSSEKFFYNERKCKVRFSSRRPRRKCNTCPRERSFG